MSGKVAVTIAAVPGDNYIVVADFERRLQCKL